MTGDHLRRGVGVRDLPEQEAVEDEPEQPGARITTETTKASQTGKSVVLDQEA